MIDQLIKEKVKPINQLLKNLNSDEIVTISNTNANCNFRKKLALIKSLFSYDDKLLIIISADPDAIASAVALKRILWRKVASVTIASTHEVKRADNIRLLKSLKLVMPDLSSLNLSNYDHFLMVDSQPAHAPETRDLYFDLVIDHHPFTSIKKNQQPKFVDIRPDIGASATILTSYLKADNVLPSQVLATALFYAIKTDTQNFVRQGQLEDMKAFRWLYSHINPSLLSDIERAPIHKSSFKLIIESLYKAKFHKNQAYSFVENLDNDDTLVISADLLMQIDEVNRSIVAGVYKDKLIIIFRAAGLRVNLGDIAKKAFGDIGSAGGHKNMARAEINLKDLNCCNNKPDFFTRFINKRLRMALTRKQ